MRARLSLIGVILLAVACDNPTVDVSPITSIRVHAVSSDTLGANPRTTLPAAVIEVIDQLGRPVGGTVVQWSIHLGGCSDPCARNDALVSPSSQITDAAGKASAIPTLGSALGVYLVIANPVTTLPVTQRDTFVFFAGQAL